MLIEVVWLVAMLVVVGCALLWPFVAPKARWVPAGIAAIAGIAACAHLLLFAVDTDLPSVQPNWGFGAAAVALTVAAVCVAVLPARRRERFGWFAALLTVMCAGAAMVLLAGGAFGFDPAARRTFVFHAGTMLGFAAVAWLAVGLPRITLLRRAIQGQVAVLALALLASVVQTVTTDGAPPPAGVALSRQVRLGPATTQVLVVPHRPGWNVVHSPRAGLLVGVAGQDHVPLTSRRGAAGNWALVQLPEGAGRLQVREGDTVDVVPFDTGQADHMSSMDDLGGPECATFALGALLGGSATPVPACPDRELTEQDRHALRATVAFLAGRGARAVSVVGDSSSRSVEANEFLRAEGARHGISTAPAGDGTNPVLIVSRWSGAEEALTRVADGQLPAAGAYLAPWLFTTPLLSIPAGQLIPLCTDPQGPGAQTYLAELRVRAPGVSPAWSGYTAWNSARGADCGGPVRMFAASLVHMRFGGPGHGHGSGTWLPGGAITPVSGTLGPDQEAP